VHGDHERIRHSIACGIRNRNAHVIDPGYPNICERRSIHRRRNLESVQTLPMIQKSGDPDVHSSELAVMRWLIDGYNLMHAGGRLGPKLGREGFRRARRRFLDELSSALGPQMARQTTVVFDASVHPGDFSLDAQYRGLGVVFALGDENADARIELLIAGDANPKTLTVVSSDRRIRQAAVRRRTRSLTADQYWELIDDLKDRRLFKVKAKAEPPVRPAPREIDQQTGPADAAHWLETFRDIDDLPEVQQTFAPNDSLLTDADIAEIERQVQREL
jgi:uncharacterized protein